MFTTSVFLMLLLSILLTSMITWFVAKSHFAKQELERNKAKQLMDQQQQELMKLTFENLAEKILNQKEEKLTEVSNKSLLEMLQPFKLKIHELQEKVEKTYHEEARERFALKSELLKMVEAGQKMSLETSNLTKALKGDVKMQGNWGEFILEKILSIAGLREGEEYIKQGQNLGMKTDEGTGLKPDVIIALPEGKHLVIDAKVSLVAYERMVNAQSSEDSEAQKKLFLQSLYQHIDDLSSKKYHLHQTLISPDFTILFIPIEGAFAFSMQTESELFAYAWGKSIVLAGPVNLLTTLKTVGSLWRQDRQNKHVLTIATEAGKLYDKMVGFVEDLLKVGEQLDKSQNYFHQAMNKLSLGRGNVITKMLQLKEMGVKHSKDLPPSVISQDDTI